MTPQTKRKVLLLSNGSMPGRPMYEYAHAAIRDFLGTRVGRVLFVPFAGVVKTWDSYAEAARTVFGELGYALDSIHEADDAGRAVERAEAFVVGGGNTFQLLKNLYETGALEAMRARALEGVPYIGSSAGSNVACPTIMTTNDMPIVEPPSFRALGLVPFQINPHYTDARLDGHAGETRDDRLGEFVLANPGVRVVGLREGTLLRVEGMRIELVGARPARVFEHGADAREFAPGDYLEFLLER
ncbi:MAG TPA: dipeptidase PepE [Pyrinomonadaceae bacterium]|nr:dipeptidase PepE [Pyrinomonadaceae bacterium]